MTKRELALGSLVIIVLLSCITLFFLDEMNTLQRLHILPAAGLVFDTALFIWPLVISAVTSPLIGALFAFGTLIAPSKHALLQRYTLRLGRHIAIPWYNAFLLPPIVFGLTLALLTSNTAWLWLGLIGIAGAPVLATAGMIGVGRNVGQI